MVTNTAISPTSALTGNAGKPPDDAVELDEAEESATFLLKLPEQSVYVTAQPLLSSDYEAWLEGLASSGAIEVSTVGRSIDDRQQRGWYKTYFIASGSPAPARGNRCCCNDERERLMKPMNWQANFVSRWLS